MTDRKKIIKGLKCCKSYNKDNCDECPYDYNGRGNEKNECTAELATDALDLLKEQEPDVIDLINKVIEEAIYHGGDPGGPYFCNEKRLEEAVRELSEALGCNYEWDEEKQHPQFIRLKQ